MYQNQDMAGYKFIIPVQYVVGCKFITLIWYLKYYILFLFLLNLVKIAYFKTLKAPLRDPFIQSLKNIYLLIAYYRWPNLYGTYYVRPNCFNFSITEVETAHRFASHRIGLWHWTTWIYFILS